KNQRRGPIEAVLAGAQHDWRDILSLPRDAVEFGRLAPVDDIRVERVGRYIAVLLNANGIPVAKRDLAEIAAAGDARAAALLLPAVDPVGELVVGDHMIELGCGLVVPGTPGRTTVHADGRTLVAGQGDGLWIFRIDPDG